MALHKTQEQLIKDYEEKSEEILRKMMHVLIRAQRKIDDAAYREILEKLEHHKK